MKVLFPLAAIVLGVFLLCGDADGFGDGFEGPFGRPPPPPRPPMDGHGRGGPPPFYECESFMKAVENQKRENERNGIGGRRSCRERGQEPRQCRFEDFMRARLMVNQSPSDACITQVSDFLEGRNSTSTTTEGTTTITTLPTDQ